jgi:putative ABC transport system permease protein
MDTVLQDAKFGLRVLFKERAFAAIVVLTIALAIGVNTVIFSFVNFFVLRPMPFKDVDTLVFVSGSHPDRGHDRVRVSYGDYHEWQAEARSFEAMTALRPANFNMTGAGEPTRVVGRLTSASLFPVWGLGAEIGRTLQRDDDRPGAERVAMLSHGFWTRRFGSSVDVLGRAIRLDGETYTIVGVVSREIEIGSFSEIDVWVPLAALADPADRIRRDLMVTARLRPGVDIQSADAELRAIAERQQREHPDTNAGWSTHLAPLRKAITSANAWAILALLAVAVSFVLAIACANVANLMLVRATARRRETAVRAALGATRARLVRQLLTEGALLGLAGGAVGLLLADWGLRIIRSVTYEQFFQLIVIDRRVLIFSAAISLLTPVTFGLAPALQAARRDLVASLRDGRAAAGGARGRGRGALVVVQMSLAAALLVVSVLTLRSAFALQNLDHGYDYKGLVSFAIDLPAGRYASDDAVRAFYSELLTRLRAAPGVSAIAAGTGIPLLARVATVPLAVEGFEARDKAAAPLAVRTVVSAGYMTTLRLPVVAGRELGGGDMTGAPAVAVVNQALVRRYLGGRDPLGARIRLEKDGEPWRTVVGVAKDLTNVDTELPSLPQVWIPFAQAPTRSLNVFVRSLETAAVVATARAELRRLDPDLALYDATTVERAVYEDLASNRVITGLFATFAAVALLLATIGLYGVVSYVVSQRTPEIGVRIALGAQSRDVLSLVLRHGAALLLTGLVVGLLGGLGLSRAIAHTLYGVSANDLFTFSVVPAVLMLAAAVAMLVPARRALRVDPLTALRSE